MANVSKRQALLLVAVELARNLGYMNVTRDRIASDAGVAMGTVTNHLGTMTQIRRAMVRYAIRNEELPIIAEAIVNRHQMTRKIDAVLWTKALASL